MGIGASAGGLTALKSFFTHLPQESGIAYVVVVHLDPNYKSQMAELLQSRTSMNVRQVTRTVKIQADNVYVIPPDRDLCMVDGMIKLEPRGRRDGARAPIDEFLRTLAETHDVDAAAIILSGTGSDGARGIRWIKERGGLTMAQTPDEADYHEMPHSAITTGHIDIVLPAAELGPELVRILQAEQIEEAAEEDRVAEGREAEEASESVVSRTLLLVRAKTGHDFTGYKRSTINRRMKRRAQFTKAGSLSAYLRVLQSDPEEMRALYSDLLITVTSFFRDAEAFEALRQEVIPRLFEGRTPDHAIRVWITGCATGEEAYSIAILLCEEQERRSEAPSIQIFATDVHERSFSYAREGLYPESISADVSPERLDKFFTRESGGYRVKQGLRDKVLFATHNILKDPPFLRQDLITCRNLLIYLHRDTQRRVLELFHYATNPSGYLFLGTSETAEEAAGLFNVHNKKQRIYRSNEQTDAPVPRFVASIEKERRESRESARRQAGRVLNAGLLHRQLLETYAPPSILVNAAHEIIHLSEGVGRYLEQAGGEPSHRLADMIRPDLRMRVRTMVTKAMSRGQAVEMRRASFTIDGTERLVTISVRPVPGRATSGGYALVLFDEEPSGDKRASGGKKGARKPLPANEVEGEIMELRAELQATVEEHEATIEELKASNEELQSINEEQKATGDELETSKEELQSINEELRTINQEHRTKNEELLQLNSDLQNLIDSTDIGIIFLDRELTLRRFTPPIEQLFSVRRTDRGRPLSDLTHRLEYPELTADCQAVLARLGHIEREVSAEGDRWFMARITPYRSLDDKIDGVIITFVEVTSSKRADLELQRLLDEVKAASLAKSDFIGVMSHEMRTPLNAIVGYADIIAAEASGPVTDEMSRHLGRIAASARHLSHMIDDSLQSARIEAGLVLLEYERVDLASLVRDTATMIQPLAETRGLSLVLDVADGPSVVTDVTKVRQILFNLLANAVRFTDIGTIKLTCRVGDTMATVAVEDTGIGIDPMHLQRIFERFWQVDQTRTRVRGGTGLGLLVSRSLARALGGDIEVTSELGRGSAFVLRLPLKPGEEATRVEKLFGTAHG